MKTDEKATGKGESPRRIKGHDEPKRLDAHPEQELLEAPKPDDETVVPPVTADIDETPDVIKYGAAVILGLAFGVGCYVWAGGGVPDHYDKAGRTAIHAAPTEAYFKQAGTYDDPTLHGAIPDPFVSPFEPALVNYNYTTVTPAATGFEAPRTAAATLPQTAPEPLGEAPATHEIIAVATTAAPVVYLFEYASAEVPETNELTAIAEQAKKQALTLDVRAYTDESGRPAYNQRLSEKRARAIGDYLIAHGVPASKVTVRGMGPTHAYANDAQDRRAEITVSE